MGWTFVNEEWQGGLPPLFETVSIWAESEGKEFYCFGYLTLGGNWVFYCDEDLRKVRVKAWKTL